MLDTRRGSIARGRSLAAIRYAAGRVALTVLRWSTYCVAALAALFAAYAIWAALSSAAAYDYGLSDMDWNQDGAVSPREFFASESIGARTVVRGEAECREFFSLKDGLPVREKCPHN
jgi:hypothetical protein